MVADAARMAARLAPIRVLEAVPRKAVPAPLRRYAAKVDPYPHLFPGECDPIELAVPLREVVFPASRWSAEIERLVDEAHASASAPEEPRPPEDQCPSHPEEPCKFPRTCQARGRCMLAPKDVP